VVVVVVLAVVLVLVLVPQGRWRRYLSYISPTSPYISQVAQFDAVLPPAMKEEPPLQHQPEPEPSPEPEPYPLA